MENKVEYTNILIFKTEELHFRGLILEFAESIGCQTIMDKTIVREFE